MGVAEPEGVEARQMQAGVASQVARWARGAGSGLRRVSPPGLVALLCAGAFGPVLAAAAGVSGAAAVAGVEVLGAVGANVLTDVITTTIDSLRSRDRTPTQDEFEQALADRIEKALGTGGTRAEQLRVEIAEVLRKVDAARSALEAAIEIGNEELQTQLVEGLAGLSADFTEFGFVLTDVRGAVAVVKETLVRQDAEHRADRDRLRRQSIQLRRIEDNLGVIERRTRTTAEADTAEKQMGARWPEGCPYRGLWPFEEDHAEIFYGREQLTAELVVKLTEHLSGPGMVVVTGASGAGKSSLLRAGLLPKLARGSLVAWSEDWPRVVITPTGAPLDELAAHFAVLGGMAFTDVRSQLAEHPEKAHLTVRQIVLAHISTNHPSVSVSNRRERRLVLVVDQFEEIFTLSGAGDGAAEAERQAFITALCAMAGTSKAYQPTALVVLGVRGDFWDRCASYPQLADVLRDGQFVVGPMTEPQLRRAITGPADAAGLEIEPTLPDNILSELRSTTEEGGYGAGALPLLSQTMLITWENRADNQLTNHGYGQAGGIRQAVQTSAEAAYDALTPHQQKIAHDVFRLMTIVGRDGHLARRPVADTDLYAAHAHQHTDVDGVLDPFTDKRLLVRHEGSAEIAHDALLRTWPRLRDWLEADQADSVLYSQLIDDATEWQSHQQDPSFLYRGTQLAAVDQATTRWDNDPGRYPALPRTSRDFLNASHRAAARNTRRRRLAAAVLVVLLFVTTITAAAAVNSANDAERQRKLVVSRQLATQSEALGDTDPTTALLLAGAAHRIAPTAESRYSVLNALTQPVRAVLPSAGGVDLELSPDGSTLATTGDFYGVKLWDVATLRQIGTLPISDYAVRAMVFSPDGNTLTTAGDSSSVKHSVVQSWNIATRRPIGMPLNISTGDVLPAALSPDGKTLTTINPDNTVQIWNVATGRKIGALVTGHTGRFGVLRVEFSPDGKTLVTGGRDKTARLWDAATSRRKGAALTGHTGAVVGMAFSPDGKTLATVSEDETARLWDAATGRQKGAALTGHTGPVWGITFSPDGKTIATGGLDKTVRLWSASTRRQLGAPFTGHIGQVRGLVFGPDAKTLITGDNREIVRLWDLTTRQQKGDQFAGHTGPVVSITFSPDGKTLASASLDKTARLWDITNRHIGTSLAGHAGAVYEVAFSPDGKTLATASGDRTARLWDVVDHRQIGTPLVSGGDSAHDVTFSPDGKTLATAGGFIISAQLWDVTTGRQKGAPLTGHTGGPSSSVNNVRFSPDGKTLATTNGETIQLWDAATRQKKGRPFAAQTGYISAVEFSPDGKTLATVGDQTALWDVATRSRIGNQFTGSVHGIAFSPNGKTLATADDHAARLWDVATRRPIGAPLTGHIGGPVHAVVFSPDGGTLATAGDDKTVRLWDVSLPGDLFASLCAAAGHSLSREEWKRHIPSEPFQQVCP